MKSEAKEIKKLKEILRKQHYGLIGNHSGVKICEWTKKSLVDEGFCYKEKFYGIKSHLCCQMTPSIGFCTNKCLHCWRAIELTVGKDMKKIKIDNPEEIINECIIQQKKLLSGFKGNAKANKNKLKQAQEPMQFAISLTGEPTLYPKIGNFIQELRKRKKTSFLVTNGLQPEVLKKLNKNKQLPTQLYVSLNAPNKTLYDKIHRSLKKNAWKKFNQTLSLLKKIKKNTRTVIRMTLVKNLNMNDDMINDYASLILKADPDFIEVKGFVSVGFSRKRLGYERMPNQNEIKSFAKKLLQELKPEKYKILDEQSASKVVLLGKSKKLMKIKKV